MAEEMGSRSKYNTRVTVTLTENDVLNGKVNRMMKTILLSTLFLLTAGFLLVGEPEGKIVCFGDSITYGALVEGNGWVDQLAGKSDKIKVENAGRKGRKTSDTTEVVQVIDRNPDADYILFFLGVNDLKNGNDSMVNNCVSNMQWIIDYTKRKIPGADIVLIAPCGINLEEMSEINHAKKYNNNTVDSLIKLEKAYGNLALNKNIKFISLLNTVSKQNYADGLHPNVEGHKEIADKIWNDLLKFTQ